MFFTPNMKVKNSKPIIMPIQGLSLSMDIKLVVVVMMASGAGQGDMLVKFGYHAKRVAHGGQSTFSVTRQALKIVNPRYFCS